MDESEKKEWDQISIIEDDEAYNIQKSNFLKKKKEKYLRLIQKDFLKNAEISIDIINKYINEKQKYLSLRQRFLLFLSDNLQSAIWLVCVSIFIAFSIISYKIAGFKFKYILQSIIIYLVIPLVLKFVVRFITGFDKDKK